MQQKTVYNVAYISTFCFKQWITLHQIHYNSSARSLSCCWQISVDVGVAFHQRQQLVQQCDNIAAVEAEASVCIQCLLDQTVQLKTT